MKIYGLSASGGYATLSARANCICKDLFYTKQAAEEFIPVFKERVLSDQLSLAAWDKNGKFECRVIEFNLA